MSENKNMRHAYCLFCRTGAENRLKDEIVTRFPSIHALIAVQEKHKIVDKRYEVDRRIFLPGYLFLYTEEELDFEMLLRIEDIYRILGDETNAHELQGSDRAFANWLLENNGVIGISRIRIVENKVQILSGPMKHFSKKILKLDKHTKNARIRMDFLGKASDIWLAFEFDNEAATDRREQD